MDETWKPVPGWPHEVSSSGRVRNVNTGRVLKAVMHKSGYLNVQLWDKGRFKTFIVHRLVAIAFIGEPPSYLHEVAHRDGVRINNAASNLRWVLHEENMRDRDIHGTTARGDRNGKLKHSDEVVAKTRTLHSEGLGSRRIAKALGLSRATVYGYIKNKRRPSVQGGAA